MQEVRLRRHAAVWAGAAVIALAAATPPAVALPRIGGGGGFSVSGKSGPFIQQVGGRKLDQSGGGDALGLASDAVNRGEFQTARLRMPQTEARIKALLDRIEANWPYDKSQPVRLMIIGVDHYSAYALPDGSIMVGFGLLDQVQSDDELAFILAHELGHIRLGHFAAGQEMAQARKNDASRMGALFAVGSVVGGAASGSAIDLGDAGRKAGATSDLIHFMNTAMAGPAHSRQQEDESDAVGFDLAHLGAYSAESASAKVFDTIQADEARRGAITDALQGQLRNELGRAVRDGSLLNVAMGGGVSTTGMLKGVARVGLGVARNSDASGPKHRTPEERKKGVAAYSVEAYPTGLPLRDEQTAWLQQTRATQEYADAKATVGAISKAMTLRAEGKLPEAEAALRPAQAGPFRAAPVVTNLSGNLRADMKDAARADALFRQAHLSPDQTVDGYVDHARMLYLNRRHDEALAVIDQAITRFGGDDKPFIALIVAVDKQAGRQDQSDRWLRRCLDYGDPALARDCNLAAGRKPGETAQDDGQKGPKNPLGGLGGLGRMGLGF